MLTKYLPKIDFSSSQDFRDNYTVIVPERFNFSYDVLDRLAKETPDERALVWCNDEGEEKIFSYSEIKTYSEKAASFFQAQGIRRGEKVMLILKRRYEFWFALLGLHRIGAIAVPATHMLTKDDLVYRNNAASIKMIVAAYDEKVMEQIEASLEESKSVELLVSVSGISGLYEKSFYNKKRDGWIDFNSGLEEAKDFIAPKREEVNDNEDIMLLYFTSGTTNHPKMVAHDYTYPLGHIVTAKYWQCVRKGGLHLTVADTGWAKSVWGKLYGQWLCECAVFVYDYSAKFKPVDLLAQIEKYKVTSFCAPPTIYRFLIQADMSKYNLSSLEECCTAGEPLSEEVYNRFKAQTGLGLLEGFGQTETTLSLLNFKGESVKPGSIGKPAPFYNIKLLKDDLSECVDGEIGEICFQLDKGSFPGLFKEYYRDAEKTREVMHDGYYFTGDTAWRDEDGFYWFVGRFDDIIKCSGYRIGTFEVESILMQHPAIVECAVTGFPDEVRGQVVKATIVLSEKYKPGSDVLAKEIQDFVKKATAPYKYPRIVEFVEELPKTISGKIKRRDIRAKD